MAESKDKARPPKTVRVKVLRAINIGGVIHAPKVDGKKLTPIEADIPRDVADSYGDGWVQVIDPPAAPAAAGA